MDYIERSSINSIFLLNDSKYHRCVKVAERAGYSSVVKKPFLLSNQADFLIDISYINNSMEYLAQVIKGPAGKLTSDKYTKYSR